MNQRIAATLVAAGLAALTAGPALAQYALDRNLQVGSGGINAAAAQVDFRSRNDLITGNVPGLGYFRDTVGYGAPGEFRGTVADETLFRFYAQSAPTAGFQVPRGTELRTSLYRYDYQPGVDARLPARQPTASFPSPGATLSQPLQMRPLDAVSRPRLLDAAALSPGPTALPAGSLDFSAPAVELGRRLTAHQDLRAQWTAAAPLDQRLADISRQLLRPLELAPSKPGEDVYLDLLSRIQQRQLGLGGAGGPLPSQAELGPDGQVQVVPRTPARIEMVSPTADQLLRAQQDADQAAREARTRRVRQYAEQLLMPKLVALTEQPSLPGQEDQAEPVAVQKLIDSLDYRSLPALTTLAGLRADEVNQMLARAEKDLEEGKYFDADRQYQTVLSLVPGQPLARVGRVHALLGAGMVLSASQQLRALFLEHPELVGVRYAARLLPQGDRLRWVRASLEDMLTVTKTRQEPALMLAYLGYQSGTEALLRYGLALAEARAPEDPLIPVLKRIWLAPRADATAPATRPAPVRP